MRDARAWRELRSVNAEWLRPWDATLPAPDPGVPATYRAMIRLHNREAREGRALALGIFEGRDLVGQLTVGGLAWGSLRGGYVGYWVDQRRAGRGIVPTSVAMAIDHSFGSLDLHRIEINIRPENAASLRVVEKLGLRYEGTRRAYLHIDGAWRDHVSFAITAEECPGGLLARLAATGRDVRPPS